MAHPYNPLIVSVRDLTDFLRSPDTTFKSRAIAGVTGLSIQKKGARWSYQVHHNGVRYHGTLGTYPEVSLKQAKAAFNRKRFAIESGTAPKPTPRKKKIARVVKPFNVKATSTAETITPASGFPQPDITFDQLKATYFHSRLEQLQAKGTNKLPDKAVQRMEVLFEQYAQPVIGTLPVVEISNTHFIRILSDVRSDTSRVKLKAVLSTFIKWLVQQSFIDPDCLNINWSVINSMTPRNTQASQNYPRVAVADIPRFIAYALRPRSNFRDNLIGCSVALVTLTAQRTGTIFCPDTAPIGDKADLFCHWEDVDLESAVLTIPSAYMKVSQLNGRTLPPFRVPLCKEAIWCLQKIKQLWQEIGIDLRATDFLVPQYDDPSYPQRAFALRHFINKTLHPESLRETGKGFFDPDQEDRVATTHGLRSSFADWAATNGYGEDLIEKALAHTMPKIQRAYRRDDLLENRRTMMDAWGEYCFSLLPFNI